MESRCVGGQLACAGYGELQLPIAAVLILFFPKSTIYFVFMASGNRCLFDLFYSTTLYYFERKVNIITPFIV